MPNHQLAAQLFTVRDFTKTSKGLAESMRKVREIGYRAVQVSQIGDIPDSEVKRIADDNGLTICATHIGYDQLLNDLDAVTAQHKLWGCRHVAIGGMPPEFRGTEDGFRRFAAIGSRIGEKLAAVDLTFSYHNHSFEFFKFGGRTGMDILFSESDPRYLLAELDTYWIQHGGGDPTAWIERMAGRMPIVHLKDMALQWLQDNPHPVQIFAEIGEGNLNWDAILPACAAAGAEWYAVEQDICQRDPFESLAIRWIPFLERDGLGVGCRRPSTQVWTSSS